MVALATMFAGTGLAAPAAALLVEAGGIKYRVKKEVLPVGITGGLTNTFCPKHTHAIGGGLFNTASFDTVYMQETYRLGSAGLAWGYSFGNPTGVGGPTLYGTAICDETRPTYAKERFRVEPGTQDSDVARCPGNLHAYSGGSQGATETDAVMNSSFPVDRGDPDQAPDDGWAVFVDNSGSERVRIRITVACGKRMPRYATEPAQVLGNTQNGTVITCEAPKRFLYGGGQVNSGGFEDVRVITASVGISADAPITDQWQAEIENHTGGPIAMTGYAICGRALD